MNQTVCRWGIVGTANIAQELAGHSLFGEQRPGGRRQPRSPASPTVYR